MVTLFPRRFCGLLPKGARRSLAAALRQGNDVIDVDVAAAGEVQASRKPQTATALCLRFFKNTQQAVALGALDFVDLFGKAVDVGQGGTQNAQGCKGGGGVVRADFAQNVGCARGGLFLCFLGGVFFFDCLCQHDVFVGRVVLSALFAFFEQGFAVDDAQVVVGGKVHQEAEHLGVVGFQFLSTATQRMLSTSIGRTHFE